MSNIQTQSWLIDRRHALRAMGTCIALPMLECMIPLDAKEKINSPRRSAFIYLANGVHSLNYQITNRARIISFPTRSSRWRNSVTPSRQSAVCTIPEVWDITTTASISG